MKNKKPLILGLDPGVKGAVAIFDSEVELLVDVWNVPYQLTFGSKWVGSRRRGKRVKVRNRVELYSDGVADRIRPYVDRVQFAIIEKVHSMPMQGSVSTFNFGYATGQLDGILGAFGVRRVKVPPSVWKSYFGLTSDKKEAVAFATKVLGWKFRSHDSAEAALLALYGFRLSTELQGAKKMLTVPDFASISSFEANACNDLDHVYSKEDMAEFKASAQRPKNK